MRIKYFNGGEFESGDLRKINIYENGVVLYTIEQSYLEEYTTRNDTYDTVYDGRVDTLLLHNEIKRAIKVNLNRNDNFYVKFVGEYSFESGKEIFIHSSEISVTDNGEKLAMKSEHEKNYLHAFMLESNNGFIMERKKVEKIVTGGEQWTIPDGGKWSSCYGSIELPCYDTFENHMTGEKGVIKRWTELETISTLQTAQRYYVRTEKSDFRKQCEQLADEITELNIFGRNHISHYDIERLLQHYNVTRKEV